MHEDVLEGLFAGRKTLPSKYFYDEAGLCLFDRICELDEYYLTRTENRLLESCAMEVISSVRPDNIIELGSGSSHKTRFFLAACDAHGLHCTYWPVDVCSEALRAAAEGLAECYPWLRINALAGDYSGGFDGVELPRREKHLVLFMGSTIGNFTHRQAVDFLHRTRQWIGRGDLLVGLDRIKDEDTLHAAYNDSAGLTAQFNMNILKVLNRRMGADFDLDNFEHRAVYNRAHQQMEMHLVSRTKHTVYFESLDRRVGFERDESIRTEISRKFSDEAIESLFCESGFEVAEHYVSDDGYFSLALGRA